MLFQIPINPFYVHSLSPINTWSKDRCRNSIGTCSTEAFSTLEARVARVALFSALFSNGSLITSSLGIVDSLNIT